MLSVARIYATRSRSVGLVEIGAYMSATAYSRLLDQFRQGWVESGHTLFNLEIRSPGSFSSPFPGIPGSGTVNYETEEVVASVSIAYLPGREGSTEAVVVVRKRNDYQETEWPTKDLIEKFKRLSSEAGAALPLAIRNRLPDQSWMHRDPGKWWIAVLASLHEFTVYNAEGKYQEKQVITNPWEASAAAIESLRLNTDSPAWPETPPSEANLLLTCVEESNDTASADSSAEGEQNMLKKVFRDSHGLISVTLEGPDFDTSPPESPFKRKHNWRKIVAVSRELLRVLKQASATTPPKPAESRTDSLQFSAVNHQVGNLWMILYHLLTIDPRTDDCHCANDDATADMLWLCYQEHHELRSAALRLWKFFSRIITPRFNDFGRWPDYNEAELGEFEAVIDALEKVARPVSSEKASGNGEHPTPEQNAYAYAMQVARAIEWLHYRCECAPHTADLSSVLKEADRLWNALSWLQQSLADSALRKCLADCHSDAVSYADQSGQSYVEAIFKAGERRYVTISMLCRHGVLFDYASRLHPLEAGKITEPWPKLPAVDAIEWRTSDGSCLDSSQHLQSRIVSEIKSLPTIDAEHARAFLEKEIVKVNSARASGDALGSELKPATPQRGQRQPDIALDDATIARGRTEAAWLESHAAGNAVLHGFLVSAANRVQSKYADVQDTTDVVDDPRRAATINMRMLETMQKNPECHGWSANKWKEHLGCRSASSVKETEAWKTLQRMKVAAKLARIESAGSKQSTRRRH